MAIAIFAGLGFVVGVLVVGTVVAARGALRVFRDVRSFARSTAQSLEELTQRLTRLADSGARAAEQPAKLDEPLARLAASRAQLGVLTTALRRVRDQATSLTAIYPRK